MVKRIVVFLSILLMVLFLGACVRSASTPPVSVVTPPEQNGATSGEQVEVPTNEVIQQLELFVTQTAMAGQISGGLAPSALPGESATPVAPGEAGLLPTETGQPVAGGSETQVPPEAGATSAPGGEAQPVQPTAQVLPTQPAGVQSTAVSVPTSTPGLPSTYTIQSGEFLFCIARRFNVDPTELMTLNGLANPSLVRPGQVLRIPQSGNPFGPGPRALKTHPDTYIVQAGDNIYSIACKYGDVSPEAIAFANGLKSPFGLTVGQQLSIP